MTATLSASISVTSFSSETATSLGKSLRPESALLTLAFDTLERPSRVHNRLKASPLSPTQIVFAIADLRMLAMLAFSYP